jgi:hypothetical protein
MQYVHQRAIPDRAPEGLTFSVACCDLNFDARDAAISHPGLRLLDELPRDTLSAHLGTHAEVGDLGPLGLFEDRRGSVDPDDAEALWRPIPVVDKDFRIGIVMQRTQELAQLAVGDGAMSHPKEWIESGVMFSDQAPERGDAIDFVHASRPDSPADTTASVLVLCL